MVRRLPPTPRPKAESPEPTPEPTPQPPVEAPPAKTNAAARAKTASAAKPATKKATARPATKEPAAKPATRKPAVQPGITKSAAKPATRNPAAQPGIKKPAVRPAAKKPAAQPATKKPVAKGPPAAKGPRAKRPPPTSSRETTRGALAPTSNGTIGADSASARKRRNNPPPTARATLGAAPLIAACTGLSKHEAEALDACARALGAPRMLQPGDDPMNPLVTHVVVSSDATQLTPRAYAALAYGAWVLDASWVLRSFEAGEWLDEKEFQSPNLCPALAGVAEARAACAEHGPPLVGKTISVWGTSLLPAGVLSKVCTSAGASWTATPRLANVLINDDEPRSAPASWKRNGDTHLVGSAWVYEQILPSRRPEGAGPSGANDAIEVATSEAPSSQSSSQEY